MASLNITVRHSLPKEEAVTRIKNLLSETKNQYGNTITNLKEDWTNNTGNFSFIAFGFDLSGQLTVTDAGVELNGKLPFAASFFKGKISAVIKEKATELLR